MPPSAPQPPSLVVLGASAELARLTPPANAFARQPWVLGVVSFELERSGRRVHGRMRAALSGAPPVSSPLVPGEAVHVFIHRQGDAPELPDPPIPFVGGGALGGGALFVDGRPLTVSLLEGRAAYDHPPPRAQSQVYCRWLRGGELELGCDFVDFRSGAPPGGAPKLVNRFVEARSVLSFALLSG